MTTTYLVCRRGIAGHAWEQIPSTSRPEFGVYVWWRCTRCPTERHDIVDRFSGSLLSRRYYHPDDYKISAEDKPSGDMLRRELVNRRTRRKQRTA